MDTTKKSGSRFYLGTDDAPVETKEDEGNAPAYRGVAYVMSERLPPKDFGNRIPVITAEVYRKVGELESLVEGVARQ